VPECNPDATTTPATVRLFPRLYVPRAHDDEHGDDEHENHRHGPRSSPDDPPLPLGGARPGPGITSGDEPPPPSRTPGAAGRAGRTPRTPAMRTALWLCLVAGTFAACGVWAAPTGLAQTLCGVAAYLCFAVVVAAIMAAGLGDDEDDAPGGGENW